MGYSQDEIFAVLNESEQDRKRRQILAKVTETVAAYRLRQMKDLQALEMLATWRRINGFDRVADGENNLFHGPRSLPPAPEEFTTSLWSEVNALKDAISMPARTRPWQKTAEFYEGLRGDLPDEEFAAIKRYVEKRSREAAQVTVTPVSTVQHCIPRSLNPEMPPDVCVSLEHNEDKMDPERDELESPLAGTGFETPGQQCHPIWETGRTTADGFLTAGVGSNLGKHTSLTTERWRARGHQNYATSADISLPTEHVRNTLVCEPGQLRHRKNSGTRQLAKKISNLTPRWEGREGTAMERGCNFVFLFPGGNFGPWEARCFCFVFFVCVPVCLLCSLFIHTIR